MSGMPPSLDAIDEFPPLCFKASAGLGVQGNCSELVSGVSGSDVASPRPFAATKVNGYVLPIVEKSPAVADSGPGLCADAVLGDSSNANSTSGLMSSSASMKEKAIPVPTFAASSVCAVNCPIGDVKLAKPACGWSSLFKKRLGNAGSFVLKQQVVEYSDSLIPPPKEIIDAGVEFWSDYLVGFFLDEAPLCSIVKKNISLGVAFAWYS